MRLDDNTRAALHYLALGVVVVGLPALLIGLVDARQTADAQAAELLVFRNGYLLGRPGEMTHCMSSRAERIAWAFLLSCLFTIALALLFRPLKRSSLGTRVPALCGAVLLCWGIFVAVARPPLRSWIQDGQLVIEHRPVLFADLTLPWGSSIERITITADNTIITDRLGSDRTLVFLRTSAGDVPFASTTLKHTELPEAYLDRHVHGRWPGSPVHSLAP